MKSCAASAVAITEPNKEPATSCTMLAIEQNPETKVKNFGPGPSTSISAPQTYEERMRAIRASFSNPDPLLTDVTFFNAQNRY